MTDKLLPFWLSPFASAQISKLISVQMGLPHIIIIITPLNKYLFKVIPEIIQFLIEHLLGSNKIFQSLITNITFSLSVAVIRCQK